MKILDWALEADLMARLDQVSQPELPYWLYRDRSAITMPESQQQNLPEAEAGGSGKEVRQPQTELGYAS